MGAAEAAIARRRRGRERRFFAGLLATAVLELAHDERRARNRPPGTLRPEQGDGDFAHGIRRRAVSAAGGLPVHARR
jgi:hypothetical protein